MIIFFKIFLHFNIIKNQIFLNLKISDLLEMILYIRFNVQINSISDVKSLTKLIYITSKIEKVLIKIII